MHNLWQSEIVSEMADVRVSLDPVTGDRVEDRRLFVSDAFTITDRTQTGRVAEWGPWRSGGQPAVVFVRRGVFECKTTREEVFTDPLHVKFYDAAHEFRFRRLHGEGEAYTIVTPTAEVVDEVFSGFGHQALCGSRVHCEHLQLHRAVASRRLDRLEVEDGVMELFGEIARAWGARDAVPVHGAQRRRLEAARAVMAGDPAADHRLADLARIAGCSTFHFARLFRAHTGASVRGYRQELRVAMAVRRIGEGQDDLTSVALDCGFSHHSHMTAAFRRRLGRTPSAVRQLVAARTRTSGGSRQRRA